MFTNLELIAELPFDLDIFVDATFSVTPFRGRQLLIVMAELRGKPRPIIYATMNGQHTEDYLGIFEFMRDGILSFDGTIRTPRIATLDFEQAIRLALVGVWPDVEISGCNFHFCQALRRYARSLHSLSPFLVVGSIHSKSLTMTMRLSLLPLLQIDAGFEALLNFMQENEVLDDFAEFLNYFRRTWFNRYEKSTWCVSERDRRTNNNLEGYNNRVKQTIPLNPRPWIFLKCLQKLAISALSNFDSDGYRNWPQQADRSLLSEPLRVALQQLENGIIDELGFLLQMSSIPTQRRRIR